MKVLIFDTETSGLPKGKNKIPTLDTLSNWPHIVQFSYILYDTSTCEIDIMKDSIVRLPEGIDICDECVKIHGITNEISASKGILLEDVLTDFMNTLEKADLLVAHNIDFDKNVIMAEILRKYSDINSIEKWTTYYNTITTYKKYYCTMQESIDLCNRKYVNKWTGSIRLKFPNLSELNMHLFNYIPKNLHNSLYDIIVCLRCFHMMNFKNDICKKNKYIDTMIHSVIE